MLALLAGALAGCASLLPQDAERDHTLKQFGTQPDVAGLYVYCDEIMGPTPRVNVFVDDQPLGQLSAPQYFYTALAPGLHQVRVESANVSTRRLRRASRPQLLRVERDDARLLDVGRPAAPDAGA